MQIQINTAPKQRKTLNGRTYTPTHALRKTGLVAGAALGGVATVSTSNEGKKFLDKLIKDLRKDLFTGDAKSREITQKWIKGLKFTQKYYIPIGIVAGAATLFVAGGLLDKTINIGKNLVTTFKKPKEQENKLEQK